MAKRIRIIVAEDGTLTRTTMAYILDTHSDLEVVAEAENGQEVVELARLHQPDVIVMDHFMPLLNGAAATAQIAKVSPRSRVIGCSEDDSEAIIDSMLGAGAVEFVTKRGSLAELLAAIRRAGSPES